MIVDMNNGFDNRRAAPSQRLRRYLLNMLWLLFIPAALLSALLAENNPAFVEDVYSTKVFPVAATLLPFQYLLPFSFFELLLFAGPVVLLVFFIRFILRLVRVKEDRLWRVLRLIQRVLIILGVCMFLFYFLWGYNYFRQPYGEIAGLPVAPSAKGELYMLCQELVKETNEARGRLPSKDGGALALEPTVSELQDMGRLAYEKALEDGLAGIIPVKGYAKPLVSSRLFSYAGVTGVYFPWTGEPNFNNDIPEPSKGSTVCHEIAHRQGFAREDEANYIAYLVCSNSDDGYLRYSGYFLALEHAMKRLYEADRESYIKLRALYSEGVDADVKAKNAYWKLLEGPVEERVTQMNDDYLRAQGQDDGVHSYGRMVDLMLAQKRQGDSIVVANEQVTLG